MQNQKIVSIYLAVRDRVILVKLKTTLLSMDYLFEFLTKMQKQILDPYCYG